LNCAVWGIAGIVTEAPIDATRDQRFHPGAIRARIAGMPTPCRLCVLAIPLLLAACAGRLEPLEQSEEVSLPPSHALRWEALAEIRDGNWFQLLNRGQDALDWRLRAIDSAGESIDLQTFIWELDQSGTLVKRHLLAAADRGVRLRLLVDDSFTANADTALLALDQHPGIELRVFNPYRQRASQAALRAALNLGEFWRLDHRMHNKVMLVDGRVAVLGGRNLGDHYFGYHKVDNFRDMELLAGGPVVADLAAAFDDYWNDPWSYPMAQLVAARSPAAATAPPVAIGEWHREESPQRRHQQWLSLVAGALPGAATLLVDEPPQGNPAAQKERPTQLGEALLTLIDGAEDELWLISAYLVPTERLERAIERALQRGVRVRVLTNSINSNNHLSAHAAYRRHLQALMAAGAEVHELRADAAVRERYIESPVGDKTLCLHAKLILVDNDRVFLGSSNLDSRSLQINTEMGLVIDSAPLNAELRQLLAPDFEELNAWRVVLDEDGQPLWISGDQVLKHQPSASFMRRIEDWFLSQLPLENEI
jgi:putative cardiolipin synthase